MQALRSALFRGREGGMQFETDSGPKLLESIPLADVMTTVARLAQASALELNALTGEDTAETPDYLFGEDGEYMVDPDCAEARDALVLEYLRRQGEFDRHDEPGGFEEVDEAAGDEMGAPDEWAREAGFDG